MIPVCAWCDGLIEVSNRGFVGYCSESCRDAATAPPPPEPERPYSRPRGYAWRERHGLLRPDET